MVLPRVLAWLPRDSSRFSVLVSLIVVFSLTPIASFGQSKAILQLRPDGPLGPLHNLRFSADGSTLYAAGNDKLVEVWKTNEGRFERIHSASLRHTIGPGPLGTIQAMSVSDDERYVVAGGIGAFQQRAGFSDLGIMIPSVGWSRETFDEVGTVSLFDTREQKTLRIQTHPGYVLATEIVTVENEQRSYLITVGNDQDPSDCGEQGLALKRSLRIFNIPDGEELFRWPVPVTTTQPKLIAWQANNAANVQGIRIAVTLAGIPNSGVHVFRPGNNQSMTIAEPFGLAADRLAKSDKAEPDKLCVSALRGVTIWNVLSGAQSDRIDLSSHLAARSVIYSLCSISSRPSIIAITVKDLSRNDSEDVLQLIDLNGRRLLLGAGIPIGNQQNPVLAVDPSGRFIAATADVASGLKIFEVAQLLNGNPQPIQQLRSDFQPIERAALVSGDGSKVLRLDMRRASGVETFDLIDESLRPVNDQVWRSYGSVIGFKKVENPNAFISSTLVAGAVGQFKFETSSTPIGKFVACKVLDGRSIAAIGFLENTREAQVRLSLYDAATGQEVRRLNGHQQIITGIEFSEDHQYLTTVSADGMVCVWALGDLVDCVDRRGQLSGVRWCSVNGDLVVSGMDDEAQAMSLKIGDKILGLLDEQMQLTEYDSPEKLFLAISHIRPNTNVSIRVQRAGLQVDVVAKLGQAADERKPLFSFISQQQPDTNRLSWLAWSPHGPFQSSGADIEEHAGWHFNPETKEDNARFAPFSQYRDQFHGNTLVRELLALGRLPDVWPPPFDADVAIRLIDEQGQNVDPDESGEYRPELPLKGIQVAVSGVPERFVDQVKVNVDDGPPISLDRSEEDPGIWFSNELPRTSGRAKFHDIVVSVDGARIRESTKIERFLVLEPSVPEPIALPVTLPELRLSSHSTGTEVTLAQLGDRQRLFVEAVVDAKEIPNNVQFIALRDGKEIGFDDVKIQETHITGSIPLVLGKNRIELQIKRAAEAVTSPAIEIVVVDPPSITLPITSTVENENLGRLSFDLRSPFAPAKQHFRLRLHGVINDQWTVAAAKDPVDPKLYHVVVSGFSLVEGQNEAELKVLDQDGRKWESIAHELTGLPQPEQPQLTLFLADGSAFESSQVAFEAYVVSKDLEEVRCHIGDRSVAVPQPVDNGSGVYVIPISLPLEVGNNHIAVSAISKSRLVATQTRTIFRSNIERPVDLVIEELSLSNLTTILVNKTSQDIYETTESSPDAKAHLTGRVRLSAATAAEVNAGGKVIRAWVNGFLQSVVPLKAGVDPREMKFSVPVLLSAEENEIRLDLPGLVQAEDSVVRVIADCQQPSAEQTLHLLVISTRISGELQVQYEKRVLELLGVKNGKMPAFKKVITGEKTYPALTGSLSVSRRIRPLLRQIDFELYRQQGANNTVLIYFEGDELRHDDGRFCLMTPDAKKDAERAINDPNFKFVESDFITSTYLGEQLDGLKCANLLFLDVSRFPGSVPFAMAGDPAQLGLGVLRLERAGEVANVSSEVLLSQIEKVLPRVSELGQLTRELQTQVRQLQGLAVSDSIPSPILRMPFGALAPN